ncbi:MAG: CotH kinase family protein [Ruminococcus sp.]|nr:CotH kinase family protein [Ruminococcus sp.]
MKKGFFRVVSAAAAVVMAAGTMSVMGAFAETIPVQPDQVYNETPATYESLGVNAGDKQSFKTTEAQVSDLPMINITTQNNNTLIKSKEEYISCVVDVFNCDESYQLSEVSAGVRLRGNSTSYYGDVNQIKKNPVPYRIKFDKKQAMLGLNDNQKFKSWALLKPIYNVICNDFAFNMGRSIMNGKNFCSDSQFVRLYVNDKFQGVYLLCEQNQVNKNRVNITEPEEGYEGTDIGYYLELDNYAWQEPYYVSTDYAGATVTDVRGVTRQFVPAEYTIKNDLYSTEQVEFIDKYLNNVFQIVYQACEKGRYYRLDSRNEIQLSNYTSAEEAIGAVMDIDSAVQLYLLYEIVHDYDCGEGSFYVSADFGEGKDSRLRFTSPWDFDWAYNDSSDRYWAGAFCEQSFVNRYGDRSNPWFILLAKQDWFQKRAEQMWKETNANGGIESVMDHESDLLSKYAGDFNASNTFGQDLSGSVDNANNTLKWISARARFMNGTFGDDVLMGDIDNNGKVNVNDAMRSIQFSKQKSKAEAGRQRKAADLNGDGKIQVKDTLILIRKVKG